MKPFFVGPSQWPFPPGQPTEIPGPSGPDLRKPLAVTPKARLLPRPANHHLLWITAAALVGLALKLTIALNTLGAEDVLTFYKFGRTLTEHGLEWSYMHDKALNHPPLVAYYVRLIYAADHIAVLRQNGISFPFLLRLPAIIADLVVVLLLARCRKQLLLPTWSLIVLALSPTSLMVSGFHGNTDPVMVMFLVLAAWMCMRGAPLWCGMLLAMSCQIKIIPLLLIPIFVCFWFSRRKTLPFILVFGATMVLLWIEPLVRCPALLVKNVLLYGGFWGCWGITYWLRLTGIQEFGIVSYHDLPLAAQIVMALLKVFIIACVLLIAWRRRELKGGAVFKSLAYGWMVFFVFSPAVAPQYLVWLVPFVLVLSPSIATYLIATSSMFLFFFYHICSGGFPWNLAISTRNSNEITTVWSLWPWAVLIAALMFLWRSALRCQPGFRLLCLAPLRDERDC
jgi:hypothetical protein